MGHFFEFFEHRPRLPGEIWISERGLRSSLVAGSTTLNAPLPKLASKRSLTNRDVHAPGEEAMDRGQPRPPSVRQYLSLNKEIAAPTSKASGPQRDIIAVQ